MPGTQFLAELTGLMSQGAAGNPSAVMMEAAYRRHGLPWRYINMEVSPEGLADAVRGARAMGFRGFNCSLPHKVAIVGHLDGLGASAAVMGAVNCVVLRDGQFIGENTDGKGFLKSLREVVDPRNKRVTLFGAGGAARAIAVELGLAGAGRISIVNRSIGRGAGLAKLLKEQLRIDAGYSVWKGDYAIAPETDIVINATSIGLCDAEARMPIDLETLKPEMVVADVICNPPQTRFLRDALARGCHVLDGLGMLVNQGAIAVKYWTGVEPEAAVMRSALQALFPPASALPATP